jgi:hypothetical protein
MEAFNKRTAQRSSNFASAQFPKRPRPGTAGKVIKLVANYLEVTVLPVGEIVQYDVAVNPDVTRALKRHIFDVVESTYVGAFGGLLVAYDGMGNLFSYGQLPKSQYSLEVELEGRAGKEPRKFVMTLRLVSTVNLAILQQFLEGGLDYTPYEVINALEIIFRNPLVSKGIVVGRSVYSPEVPNKPKMISGGLEVWGGFFYSLRAETGKMLLNVDSSSTAFYAPGPVLDAVRHVIQDSTVPPMLSLYQRKAVESLLRGACVEVTHRGAGFSSKYQVRGLGRTAEEVTFQDQDGRQSNVADYFSAKYNLKLRYPKLPCLFVGTNENQIYLPMEVCEVPDGQRYAHKLNETLTAELIKIASVTPEKRLHNIRAAIPLIQKNHAYYDNFQLRFGNELVNVESRVLAPPCIRYSINGRRPSIIPAQGTWNMRDKKLETGATVKSWSVLVLSNPADLNEIHGFLQELVRTADDIGMKIEDPTPPIITASEDLEESLRTAAAAAEEYFFEAPQFILVVLPSKDSKVYGEIKRVGDTALGIPTQCMQSKRIKTFKQYFVNICLKINLKLGGANWRLGYRRWIRLRNNQRVIFFGADVAHPGIGESEKPSIAAVVASMDCNLSRYAASVRVQGSRKEVIEDMRSMVRDNLINYRTATKELPSRIIFFRDGVGETQFKEVAAEEVKAIKDACEDLSPTFNPALVFVLVQKRHHTRFFCADDRDADLTGNIPAGTVVDSPNLLNPNLFEFFLCSHAGLQGTSRPTRYVVVHDELKLSADDLQELTYDVCHTFGRCTRSVSIATPVYYAHLAAFRARFHFSPGMAQDWKSFKQVKPQVAQGMYFI